MRILVDQWGGPLLIAKKLGYTTASFIVQMVGPNPTREVSEKTARKVEAALDLPAGFMDAKQHMGRKVNVDVGQVSRIVQFVAQHAQDVGVSIPPTKLGDIVALVYQDAANRGSVNTEYVRSIIQLLK